VDVYTKHYKGKRLENQGYIFSDGMKDGGAGIKFRLWFFIAL